jgi:hypothetical protein
VTRAILEQDSPLHSLVLVGDYGSGKTEVSVNLALHLSRELERPLAIADLDLVNPYFRCREAREPLEQAGIRVVAPQGGQAFADLPILLPQVKGLLQDPSTFSLLDVGGDEAGARVLAGLAPAFDHSRHGFWFVVNGRRPFCDTPDGVLAAIRRVEQGARGWKVSGLVSNTHLMEETTPEMILEGIELSRAVGRDLGVELVFAAVMEPLLEELDPGALDLPVLAMKRMMVPPWQRRPGGDASAGRHGVTGAGERV